MSKFHVAANLIGNYLFTFKTDTGQQLLYGAGFYTKAACLQALSLIKTSAPDRDRYVQKGVEGKYYFVLMSEKGRSVGVSGLHKTRESLEAAIKLVQETAPTAKTFYEESARAAERSSAYFDR